MATRTPIMVVTQPAARRATKTFQGSGCQGRSEPGLGGAGGAGGGGSLGTSPAERLLLVNAFRMAWRTGVVGGRARNSGSGLGLGSSLAPGSAGESTASRATKGGIATTGTGAGAGAGSQPRNRRARR